jgi:hypothetical protein
MLFEFSGPARQCPTEFSQRLKHLTEAFAVNLCQINEPNVLARVCADLGPQRVLQTVIAYLSSKPSQLESVPLICVCQLFLVVTCQQNSMPIDSLINLTNTSGRLTINAELQDLVCSPF